MKTINNLGSKVKLSTSLSSALDRFDACAKELKACRNAGEDDRAAMRNFEAARQLVASLRS
jgi:hypothetical protein